MSRRHTDLMLAVGMAGAIPDSYLNETPEPDEAITKKLVAICQATRSALVVFGKVGKENLVAIESVIDKAQADKKILGRARSIITYIDYAIWLLEATMSDKDGVKAPAKIRGAQGLVYIKRIIAALVDLRIELAGNRNYDMCSIAGISAAERFMSL